MNDFPNPKGRKLENCLAHDGPSYGLLQFLLVPFPFGYYLSHPRA